MRSMRMSCKHQHKEAEAETIEDIELNGISTIEKAISKEAT